MEVDEGQQHALLPVQLQQLLHAGSSPRRQPFEQLQSAQSALLLLHLQLRILPRALR